MQQALRGSVAAAVLGLLLTACGAPGAPQPGGPPGGGGIAASPVPSLSRTPFLVCGHDYFGAMIPHVVDATASDTVTIPADEKVLLRLSDDCAHGAAVQLAPGSALSLTQYFPDQAHVVAAWASSRAGDSTVRLTAANGQVRTLTVRAGAGGSAATSAGASSQN